MKILSKQFQQAENIVLVQVESLEGEGLGFRPAAPAIDGGGLVIREVKQEGAVNTLLAINQTRDYLLLTDMDLLKGAKQNRVVNTSVLIAPHSEKKVDVSCVERSRWSYNSPKFKTGSRTMDSKMRAAKAASLRNDMKKMKSGTQSKIWAMINEEMVSHNLLCPTEDYNSILESKAQKQEVNYKFLPEKGSNGLAVFNGKKLLSFDIFGNREAYRHYFDQLAHDALGSVQEGTGERTMDKAEVFYRLEEFLDTFESQLESSADEGPGTIGTLRWSGDQEYSGFELSHKKQPVHMAGFLINM